MAGPAPVSPVQCYVLRRTNPFRGVAAVVKTPTGRALSIDGLEWQVQVLAQPPKGLWSGDGHEAGLKYFRFGNWSKVVGISRVPLNPILDSGRMLEEAAELVTALETYAGKLPFPLLPELEHWLLDRNGAPLALLGTAVDESELDEMGASEWSAGGRGEQPFIASSLTDMGIRATLENGNKTRPTRALNPGPSPGKRGRSGAPKAHTFSPHMERPKRSADRPQRDAELLEQQVRRAAGRRLNTQWFRRGPDGALGLAHRAAKGLAGRFLPETAFPPLLLREDWSDRREQALVSDYIAWLSPYLLTLPGLDDALRRQLEGQAVHRALLVDAIWRLYPRILDQDLVNRARVEARLRRASV